MRALTLTALCFLFVGCARSRGVNVEDSASIVANRATTQALGVETLGGVFTPLIRQGTKVPCSASEIFSTATDGQSQITVSLFLGTEPLAAGNHPLGRFQVIDIPYAPRGVPRVEITFAISERSISLSARDLSRRVDLPIVRMADRTP